jgi:predicted RNA binding protein YcfA (HicA-like mRNA interferase family)
MRKGVACRRGGTNSPPAFDFVSQRGSHVKYRKAGSPTRTVVVPAGRKEIPRGTLRSILRQSGLDERAFD